MGVPGFKIFREGEGETQPEFAILQRARDIIHAFLQIVRLNEKGKRLGTSQHR